MNKKVLTLCVSALLTSAFSVYSVDAKPMLATSTQVETRAVSEDVEETVELAAGQTLPVATLTRVGLGIEENNAALTTKVLSGFTDDSRIAYVGLINTPYSVGAGQSASYLWGAVTNESNTSIAGYNSTYKAEFYWTLRNGSLMNDAGRRLSVEDLSDNYEIVPLKENGAAETSQFFVIARRNAAGQIQYVKIDNTTVPSTNILAFTDPAGSYSENIDEAALFVSVETAYITPISATTLNAELGENFELSVSSKLEGVSSVVNADVFAGMLKAVNETLSGYYRIQNDADEYIVFDTNENVTSDGYSLKGQFKTTKNIVAGQCSYFQILEADNDSEDVLVNVLSEDGTTVYRLYIANAAGTYALTISNQNPVAENWAATTLGGGNYTNLRQFLTGQYVTVDFVEAADPTDSDNDYKEGGRLAVLYNEIGGTTENHVDYVKASNLYENAPEAQWAVSSAYENGEPYYNGTITLTNRENPAESITIPVNGLRTVRDALNTYEVVNDITNTNIKAGEQIKIQFVEEVDKHDGYAVFSDNDLRNETYYLGQLRQTADGDMNVYWTENHTASHQIGATVDSLQATKWNLSLVKKANAADHTTEVDSILVVSTLNRWNAEKSRVEASQDTLVILPYAFQNRSNNEFTMFNSSTNLNYYECNEETDPDYTYGTDAMFALKRKADVNGQPIYNYVMLDARESTDYTNGNAPANVDDAYATYKVYQENSTDRGTWKNMQMYANDANSLMFVTKVQAPEYRKLVANAALDTISLYRGENDHQVVYEKKDARSIVDGDTLSFLNVDNDIQFADINPALYADSAYVNRGDNTCWQYLLGVNIVHHEGYYCEDHGFNVTPPCEHAKPVSYNQGRYLMNMIDTANVYAQTEGIHNNPYINENEENAQCAKLMFVDAIHVLTDSINMDMADKLYIITENAEDRTDYAVIPLNSADFNTVKFAFKYIDSMTSDAFKIQTQWKAYSPTTYGTNAYPAATEEGYLRWVNGCIVVDEGYQMGDVFNMNEDETRTPTANEEISAENAAVSVVATDGAVVIKGAEGKNVVIATILGKVVANETVNSDNETIAVPAGIAVVSVDGESFKVVVK